MRDRFPGNYRPTEEEFEDLWARALIVPDTNVLLNLYRLNEGARQKLLEILAALGERIFVPHQVVAEYQRNRLNAIEQQTATYAEVEKAISGFAESVGKNLRQHPRLDRKDLESRLEVAVAPVQKHLEELRESHPDPLTGEDPLGPDTVRDALEPLVSGRIGDPRDLEKLVAEGRKRYERKQPPGWKDKDKPEPERYGDLAIWLDIVAKAEEAKLPVILVTEERKPDWWEIRHNKTLGPQPALVGEMREKAGQAFWLYGIEGFMKAAAEALEIDFSEDEREEVARVETAASSAGSGELQWWQDTGATGFQLASGAQISTPLMGKFVGQHPFRPGEQPVQFYGGGSLGSAFPGPGFLPSGSIGSWKASEDLVAGGALLRVAYEPQMVGAFWAETTLSCVVIDPAGERFVVSVKTDTASATVRFPEEFSGDGVAGREGEHAYAWHSGSGIDGMPIVEVATGTFRLGSAADPG